MMALAEMAQRQDSENDGRPTKTNKDQVRPKLSKHNAGREKTGTTSQERSMWRHNRMRDLPRQLSTTVTTGRCAASVNEQPIRDEQQRSRLSPAQCCRMASSV